MRFLLEEELTEMTRPALCHAGYLENESLG